MSPWQRYRFATDRVINEAERSNWYNQRFVQVICASPSKNSRCTYASKDAEAVATKTKASNVEAASQMILDVLAVHERSILGRMGMLVTRGNKLSNDDFIALPVGCANYVLDEHFKDTAPHRMRIWKRSDLAEILPGPNLDELRSRASSYLRGGALVSLRELDLPDDCYIINDRGSLSKAALFFPIQLTTRQRDEAIARDPRFSAASLSWESDRILVISSERSGEIHSERASNLVAWLLGHFSLQILYELNRPRVSLGRFHGKSNTRPQSARRH